jgi:PPM family protein phosphatase
MMGAVRRQSLCPGFQVPDADVAVSWSFGVLSDRGKRRPRNEDAAVAVPVAGLFAVADGMGGHAGGEVASRLAGLALGARAGEAEAANRAVAGLEPRLRAGFAAASAAIRQAAQEAPALAEMGTTLTALLLDRGGRIGLIGHIGDSRAYLLRDGTLRQLTRDDTWVQDQIDAGRMTRREARRHPHSAVLTRVIGAREAHEPVFIGLTAQAGDTLLLCTDGLNGMIRRAEIQRCLAEADEPARIAEALVAEANRRGGRDNITVIVLRAT